MAGGQTTVAQDWVTVDDGDWQTVSHPELSPETLASNKAVSRMQFESNLPESTIKSRAMEAARGILEPFDLHNVPGLLSSVGGAMYDALTGKGTAKAQQMVEAAIRVPIEPVKETIEGAVSGDYDKMAHGAGGILSQTVPAVAGATEATPKIVRGGLREVTTPEALMLRAANNRTAATDISVPTSTAPAAVLRAVGNAIRIPLAKAEEATARFMASSDKPPIFSESTLPATDKEEIPFTPPAKTPAIFPGEIKPPPGPAREIPFTMPQEPNPLDLDQKPVAGPRQEIEAPELAAIQKPGQATIKSPAITMIENAIAPSGNKAKLSTLRNAPRLADVAPEVANLPKGRVFDTTLVKAFKRVEDGVVKAEDAVPDSTLVPKAPIVTTLVTQMADYAGRGLDKAANQVQGILDKWKDVPDQIPWQTFVDLKRGFFKEANPNSAISRRAYGALMDATSSISQDLATANYKYSVVRRALGDANIDVVTGRRIGQVGKASSKALPGSADQPPWSIYNVGTPPEPAPQPIKETTEATP